VFAVGEYYITGFVLHYDGSSWSQSATAPMGLGAIWGASAADVFAAGGDGSAGLILHYDGLSWSTSAAGLPNSLNAVWGVAR